MLVMSTLPQAAPSALLVESVRQGSTAMGSKATVTLVLLALVAVLNSVDAQKTTLLFAFGDSYADVGNLPKTGPNFGHGWVYPYGVTWPAANGVTTPAGRFSDGKIQTDWFADLLGLPVYPPPYLYSANQDTSSGVNFAVGGSGVTYDNGAVSLGAQVDNFQLFLRTDPYSKTELANSLTLVSVVGNDYLRFTGKTSAELFVFIERVVSGIQSNLQRLYDLGVRNVLVANMFEEDCIPLYTRANGYKQCSNEKAPFIQTHNAYLLGAVQSINTNNPGARFIILDQWSAFNRLFQQASQGGFELGLKPCCEGITNTTFCGDVDATGKWLYTVCKHRGDAIFWDAEHPTMWAWNYIVNLYANETGFILLADAPTLKQWLQINDVVQEPIGAPEPAPDLSSAEGQVQATLNYLLDKPQYSEALGLLQSFNLETLLSQQSSQVVTVFLPTNDAISATDKAYIDNVFAQNKVNEVSLYHVAQGYYDLNAIVSGKPGFIVSLTGEQLPLAYPPAGVYVGRNSQAKVVDPNLYTAPGQVVVHGIDHLLTPAVL